MNLKRLLEKLPFRKKKPATDYRAIALVITLAALAAAYMIWEMQRPLFRQPAGERSQVPSRITHMTFDFGDGTKRQFLGALTPHLNPLLALEYSAETAGLPYVIDNSEPSGRPEVAQLGGKVSNNGKQWVLFVNGEKKENPTAYQIKLADEILWKYE